MKVIGAWLWVFHLDQKLYLEPHDLQALQLVRARHTGTLQVRRTTFTPLIGPTKWSCCARRFLESDDE